MDFNLSAFAKKNKILTGVIALIILLVVVVVFNSMQGALSSTGMENTYYGESEALSKGVSSPSYDRSYSGSGSYVEVTEGSMSIETKNAESDAEAIKSTTASFGGYLENTMKSENDLYVQIYLRARVPSDKFDDYFNLLKQNYDEKSFNIQFYRVSTQKELDELQLIESTLNNYEDLRTKANKMDLTKDQLEILMDLTKKELELKQLQKQYTSSLSDKEQRGEYSMISITLQQQKEIKITPENLKNRLKNKAKQALDDSANSVMDILTGTVSLFFAAIKYAVYLIVLFVPLAVGYKIAKRLYAKLKL